MKEYFISYSHDHGFGHMVNDIIELKEINK